MYQSVPSPGRSAPKAAYGFATPVRTPSTSYHANAYSQALTPADASASKAVRFQNRPLPSQQQQQQQPALSQPSTTTPNRSPYYDAVSASTSALPQSTQPRAAVISPASTDKMPKLSVSSTSTGTESTIALTRRIKWNLGALGLLWIVPALTSKPRDAYWLVLDQIYLHVGGEADEIVDGVVGWILWAISVVLVFNAVEAAVLVRRAKAAPASSAPQVAASFSPAVEANKAGSVLGMHSPSVAKSINFVAASRLKGSPKTRTSNIGAASPISRSSPGGGQQRASPTQASPGSATVDYSQFSPSVRRSPHPVAAPGSHNAGFGGSNPTATPTSAAVEYTGIGAASSSSPLAAFRARHAPRASSSSPSSLRARSVTPAVNVDLSFDAEDAAGETFLGDESFEVDRALRSLRSSMGGVSSTPAPFR